MPGNTTLINNVIEYYVGDSKMDELMEYLKEKGYPLNKEAKKLNKEELDDKEL